MRAFLGKIICWLSLAFSPSEKDLSILSGDETINYVLKNNLSLIRFGDGEFRMMYFGFKIHDQKSDKNLRRELKTIFRGYSKTSKYLLSIPKYYEEDKKWFDSKPYVYTAVNAPWRLLFRMHRKKDMIYGDSYLFGNNEKSAYDSLWKNEKEIILVHNNEKWAKSLEKEYKLKVDFVKIPERNAYDKIDEIEAEIREKNKDSKKKVLISAGPTAKALVYRLSKEMTLYDTGHCFDRPLKLA